MVGIERVLTLHLLQMYCNIRSRSGDLISAGAEGTFDDEASVASKTIPGNQSLGVRALAISAL